MQNITIVPSERKSLIIEMKRERRPSRRLRMHIALLASEGLSPTEIARVLFCSCTTVYTVVSRFIREGCATFDDRGARGPRSLLREAAKERVEKLLEKDSPTSHGWPRSRWNCKFLCLQLTGERLAQVSGETVRRALHALEYRWRRLRPVPPEKDSPEQIEEKRTRLEDVLQMTDKPGSFFQDETKLETNPKVGFCWMRKGCQRPLRTPGTNRKVWISGALNFQTGRLHWVFGRRRDGELFIRLLDKLRRTYRCHKELHLAVDNDGSHTSKRVGKYVEDLAGASGYIHCPHGRLRATRWSLYGGLCTRSSVATMSAPIWMSWWSSPRAISKRGNRSD